MFQNNVRRYVFVLQIERTLLSMFCTWFVTLWKKFPVNPPHPTEITTFKPPSPSEFPMIFRGGWGGVWIFCGTTHYYLAGSETLKPRRAVLHIIMYRICSKRKMQKEKGGFGKFQVITGPLAPSTVPTNDEK